MKLFRRRAPLLPDRRQVRSSGRTNAYAYYSQRSNDSALMGRNILRKALDPKQTKRAVRYWAQRSGAVLLVLAFIAGGINLLWLSTDARVLPLDSTQPALVRPMAAYQQAADTLLGRSFWNHNKITIDTGAVTAGLKQQFPELSVVSVTLPLLGQRPIIYVASAGPELALVTSDGSTYVIDSNGRAIGTADAARIASLHLTLVRDQSGAPIHVGQLALSASSVSFMHTVLYQIGQKHLSLSAFVLPVATSELDMYLNGSPYFVKFNLANDSALQQVGTFLAAKHTLEGRAVTPSQYIDVRIDGRVYYK